MGLHILKVALSSDENPDYKFEIMEDDEFEYSYDKNPNFIFVLEKEGGSVIILMEKKLKKRIKEFLKFYSPGDKVIIPTMYDTSFTNILFLNYLKKNNITNLVYRYPDQKDTLCLVTPGEKVPHDITPIQKRMIAEQIVEQKKMAKEAEIYLAANPPYTVADMYARLDAMGTIITDNMIKEKEL